MRPRRVSMADIAEAAGVSAQTVSRVVNQSPRVDPATRARVEEAMGRLGYRIHRAARTLRTGRSQTIGLVAATLDTIGNSRMLQAVADVSAARGYALVVATLNTGGSLDGAFEHLREQGADGAIVLNEATALMGTRLPADLHLVTVDTAPRSDCGVVQTDHAAGARAATDHLLDLGHESVVHLGGPESSFAATQRMRGWRDALDARGASGDVVRGDWSAGSGHRAGRELAATGVPTAIFAANDQMALGLLRALADAGLDVPRDVSIVGFDDVADAAEYRPPLTTVRQDFDALGERAVRALLRSIDGEAPAPEVIPTTLVIRSSTGAPPRG